MNSSASLFPSISPSNPDRVSLAGTLSVLRNDLSWACERINFTQPLDHSLCSLALFHLSFVFQIIEGRYRETSSITRDNFYRTLQSLGSNEFPLEYSVNSSSKTNRQMISSIFWMKYKLFRTFLVFQIIFVIHKRIIQRSFRSVKHFLLIYHNETKIQLPNSKSRRKCLITHVFEKSFASYQKFHFNWNGELA